MDSALISMLELIDRPAFTVRDNKIHHLNAAAKGLLLRPQEDILPLLLTGHAEYQTFSQGCLCLQLCLGAQARSATVTSLGDEKLFIVEAPAEDASLRSMALSARSLRDPLSDIMASTDQLAAYLDDAENAALRSQLTRINRNAIRLLRQIANMSDAYSYAQKPQSGMRVQCVNAVLDEIFDRVQVFLAGAQRQIVYQGSNRLASALVDETMLERLVLNLLSNALKFAPTGPDIQARLTVESNTAHLTIHDPASLLSNQDLGAMFLRYQRAPSMEDSSQGIGLGMTLVRLAAESHGGALLVSQAPQGGVVYSVFMPLRQPEETVSDHGLHTDYAGGIDHVLLELSDILPADYYSPDETASL